MSTSMGAVIPPPPKPLALPELLDRSFQHYRRHFFFFAAIAIVCALPDVIAEWMWGSGAALGTTRLVIAPYALGVLSISATQVVIWNEASLNDVFRAAFLRYFRFAGLALAYLLCTLSLVLLPLGIWMFVRWGIAAPALAAEPIGRNDALRRSAALVKGAWWRCFVTMLTVLVLSAVMAFVLGLSAGFALALVPGLPEDISLMLAGSAAVLTGSLVVPFVAIAFSLLYVDLRVRKEAFDLDYLARSAAQAA